MVGIGVWRVTSAVAEQETPLPVPPEASDGTRISVPFRLLLSAPATSVEIDTGEIFHPESTENPITGTLTLDSASPHIALVVRWKSPVAAGEHRFAKLTVEPPGQPSALHVFDADGDIDDFLELPAPATP